MPENKTQRIDRAVIIAWGIIAFFVVGFITWRNQDSDGVTALYTILLVLVGAGQLGLFWWQLRLIRESLADTKLAADAANKSAEAAITAQRPWIKTSLKVFNGLTINGETMEVKFDFTVVNVGTSPATHVKTLITLELEPDVGSVVSGSEPGSSFPPISAPGYSLFVNDKMNYPISGWLTSPGWAQLKEMAERGRGGVVAVTLRTKYKFIGGEGETRKVYFLSNGNDNAGKGMVLFVKEMHALNSVLTLFPINSADVVR